MPLNLLIADDSATIHKVISMAFEGEDVSVLTAENGQEALDKTNEVQPDIMFADTEMPELNGFELCQKIKEDEKLKKIPICLIHSDFKEFDEEKYRACGADSHLPKPFKSEDILNMVAEITGGAGRKKKDEITLIDDLFGTENMESEKKPQEKLDELEILPLDEVEKEIQGNEAIELKPENAIDVPPGNDNKAFMEDVSDQELSKDEIENFMEDMETDNDLEKELGEFNEALNVPDEELGEAEPYIEKDKPGISKKPESEKTFESELAEGEIKEEKEDLVEDTGILPDKEIETPQFEKTTVNKPPKSSKQISGEDFERLIGGYIKQVIEDILKESIQGEISTITDKIVRAVERIAREITPDISRTIIQKEIEKIKNPET